MGDVVDLAANFFNPNEPGSTFVFPTSTAELYDQPPARTAGEYCVMFENATKSLTPLGLENIEISKANNKVVPTAYSYGHIAYMPDPTSNGVIEYPGIQPSALRKVVKENVAPQLIIGMRTADVLRYSQLSDNLWKPGWRIETRDKSRPPTDVERKEILEAQKFLMNSTSELDFTDVRQRDERKLSSFADFLDAAVRDTLTYGAIALWTDCDAAGKVKAYSLLPAGNVRLTGSFLQNGEFRVGGYMGNPKVFAVLVNDAKVVVAQFTREEATYYIRNPRTDIDIYGYGYSEIEIAIRLIQGYQNALDMNIDTFSRSAIPNGILVLKGGQVTQKQLDLLNRMWTNMKKGVTKSWALPVLGLNEDSEIEVLDMSRMKGNEGYYKEFINMLIGALCAVYRFPTHRLGYKTSGMARDSEILPDSSTAISDADDPGLAPLLMHLEGLINQYLIGSRWPHLTFFFNGKNPKEDARAYEARRNAMVFGETRTEADLQSLEKMIESEDKEEIKTLMRLMMLAPIDPNLSGIYQTMTSVVLKALFGESKDEKQPGNSMESSRDPAKSEEHGATSGVRRDSKAESPRKT